ncbi:hypothetical protein GCM10017779_23350 [Streptomyces capillispiralis]|uniref:Uncharacterized protein n=1 Tax=Streptomyces capillispiralis TaxID=68182 RepID=A0A561TB29_9ACTN|nr:hypothetical protein FHX78_111268 [Streptomyces capillispiralis]GHH91878.1 hypothetical protein GCM10017779_23350 [Streptomyces capillispiralis]
MCHRPYPYAARVTSDTSTTPPDEAPDGTGRLRSAAQWAARATAGTQGLVSLLLTDLVAVLGAAAVWLALGGDPAVVGVTGGALLAFGAAMLPIIERQSPKDAPQLWPPVVLVVIPLAVLAVGLPALAVWAFLESRPVDVTHRVRLEQAPPLVDGETVVATLHTDDPRSRLAITFDLAQSDSAAPVCAPGSELVVGLKAGAGTRHVQSGVPGTEFVFGLGRGMTDIELAVQLRAEQGCELNLSVASAHLDD